MCVCLLCVFLKTKCSMVISISEEKATSRFTDTDPFPGLTFEKNTLILHLYAQTS